MAASHNAALSHEQLLAALERRFDYLSARAVASELLAVAGVAPADAYDAAASAKLRAAVESSLTRAHAVLEALGPQAPVAAAPVKAAPAVEAPAPTAEPAVEAAPADDAAAADKTDKKKKA